MRILHKKELGCQATAAAVLKEEEREINENSKKSNDFWDMLGGKKGVKCKCSSTECYACSYTH